MLLRILPPLVLTTLALSASGQEAPEVPLFMPIPEGWRTETIPFPLEFAPELAYEGLEEIRFAPGMFQEGAEDFWSYAFVWWLPMTTTIDAEILSTDLESYFRGLSLAAADRRGFDPGEPVFAATIGRLESRGEVQHFAGEVDTFDAFASRQPIELNVQIRIWDCAPQERRIVFFELSPQPPSHAIWQTLRIIREGFRCQSAAPAS